MRRYYERPEQPQQTPRTEPDPNAPPTPRPDRPEHDFHARVGSFGSTPALLRRLGLAVDVVLDGVDAGAARAALAGATWVSVTLTSPRRRPGGAPAPAHGGRRRRARCSRRGRATRGWAARCRSATTSGWCSTSTPTRPASSSTSTPRNLARQYAERGQRRPGDVGARHAALDRLRARPPRAGRPAARPRAGGRGAGGRRRHARAAAGRPRARHPGRGLGRRDQGVAQPAPAAGHGDGRARAASPCSPTSPTSGSCSSRRSTGRPATRRTGTTCTRSSPGGTAGACRRRGPG